MFGYAGVKKLYRAQFPDIYCDHHGIHSFDTQIDIHKSGNPVTQPCNTVVKKVYPVDEFIIVTAFAKTGKEFITHRLFLTAGRVE